MDRCLRALALEDVAGEAELAERELMRAGFRCTLMRVETEADFRRGLEDHPDIILSDVSLPEFDGMAALRIALSEASDIPFIFVSGTIGEERAIEALKLGATDYVLKNNLTRLGPVVARALQEFKYRRTLRLADQRVVDALNYNRLLTEVSPVGVIAYRATGAAVSANEAAAKLVGATVEQLRTQNFRDIESWKKSGLLNMAEQALATNSIVEGDVHLAPTTFGQDRWITARFAPFEYNSQQHVLGLFADISDRKLVEEALRESEDRNRDLVENSRDLICTHDLEGRLLSANAAISRLTGHTSQALLGKNLRELLTPPMRDRFPRYLTQLRDKGHAEGVMALRTTGGETRYLEFRNTLRAASVGRSIVRGMARDVTERRQAEKALKASEAKFKALFETANDAIFIMNAEVFLDCNRQTEVLFGCRKADIIGRSPAAFSPPEQPDGRLSCEKAAEYIQAALAGVPQVFEWQHARHDRTLFEAEVSLNRIEIHGAMYLQAIVRDITRRKARENILRFLSERVSNLSGAAFFNEIAARAADYLGMEVGFVCGVDGPAGSRARTLGLYIDGRVVRPIEYEIAHTPCEVAIGRQTAIFLDGVQERFPEDRMLADLGISAYAAVPMFGAKGDVIGHVGVMSRAPMHDPVHLEEMLRLFSMRSAAEIARQSGEESLNESEAKFRGLVEQSLIGIYLVDGEKVLYHNPRADEIFGYEPGELVGVPMKSLVMDEDWPAAEREIRRLVSGEVSVICLDFRGRRKDGREVVIEAQGTLARADGRPIVIGVLQDVTDKRRAEERIQRYVVQIENAFIRTVEVATTISEMRDPYTAGHERRVAEIAVAIGAELGFDAHRQEGLRVAGYLHDVGKITIPSEILSKPGKLSTAEFALIKGHPQASFDILKKVEFPWPIALVALQHHERLDGGGYPQGLKGGETLLESRIMAVADVVEAMASHRPYRAGLGIDKALAEIERGRGTAYDPAVADACLRMFRENRYQLPE